MAELKDKTVARVLDVAELQLGYTESPAHSNQTKYGKAFGLDGQPWCLMFVWWVFQKAGFQLYKTASCTTLVNRYLAGSPRQIILRDFKPGDIVFFDFSGQKNKTEHVGIVKRVSATGSTLTTIEGNTSTGDNCNGGMVMERKRRICYVTCAIRPNYPD